MLLFGGKTEPWRTVISRGSKSLMPALPDEIDLGYGLAADKDQIPLDLGAA